ncbi:MAG: carbohydrate kinase family protein [Paracoccaceae bacterium]
MILCCGEALIDMLPAKTRVGGQAFAPCPGGAAYNSAAALARLGTPAGLFAGLSEDLFGRKLAAALEAAGVDTRLAPRSARPTALAFVQLVGGQPCYAFYDEGSAGRMVGPQDLPALPEGVEALLFGGISLAEEPCGAAYEALMARAGPRVTLLDPNIRPALIAQDAAYRMRLDRMIALADIVKLSDEDLRWLLGDGDPAEQARGLLARGPKLVLLTEGARGATAFTARGKVSAPARRVPVIDTVGAGDVFNAAALTALRDAGALAKPALAEMDQDRLRDVLDFAQRAAAYSVTQQGAAAPRREDLR